MIAYRGIDAFNRREFSILVRNGDKIVLAYNKYAKEWWNIDQEWRDCSLEKEWYLTPPSIKILGDPSPYRISGYGYSSNPNDSLERYAKSWLERQAWLKKYSMTEIENLF
jgi:hypothetical protein